MSDTKASTPVIDNSPHCLKHPSSRPRHTHGPHIGVDPSKPGPGESVITTYNPDTGEIKHTGGGPHQISREETLRLYGAALSAVAEQRREQQQHADVLEHHQWVQELVAQVECKPYGFIVGLWPERGSYIQVLQYVRGEDGNAKYWTGRKWYVSKHATDSEIVQTCLKATLAFAEHEIREAFTYDGQQLFGPHMDLHALMQAAAMPRDERPA